MAWHRRSTGRLSIQCEEELVGTTETNMTQSTTASDVRSRAQEVVAKIMTHDAYEIALGLIAAFNVALLVIDLDASVACPAGQSCKQAWLGITDHLLLGVYTGDLLGSLFYQQLRFFRLPINCLDLVIVSLGFLELMVSQIIGDGPGLNVMRMLRMARMLRVAKLLKPLPELQKLICGVFLTIRAIFWGFVMILLLLLLWSIIILQMYSSMDTKDVFQDERFGGYWCEQAMESTLSVVLLLWQIIIAGDAWGACTLPVILRQPWMYWLYAGAFVCINIGFMNLILALIVDSANAQHEEETLKTMEELHRQQAKDIEGFRDKFKGVNKDGSEGLSLQELLSGFDDFVEFRRTLLKSGIGKHDLEQIFDYLDLQGTGEVTYTHFVHAVFGSKRQDPDTQLMKIQFAIDKLLAGQKELATQVSELRSQQGLASGDQEHRVHSAKVATLDILQNSSEPKAGHCCLPIEAKSETKARPGTSEGGEAQFIEAKSETKARTTKSEDLKIMQLETLELRLQSATGVLQQQSMGIADQMQKLHATLERMDMCTRPHSDGSHALDGKDTSTKMHEAQLRQCSPRRSTGALSKSNSVSSLHDISLRTSVITPTDDRLNGSEIDF